ncbi:S8 family serine peptidase [Oculatella sp. LEGE 06141]|uniref:S8 family serine peptidase n=1 Tax=Oculatella sp. LEGE 06141 TaxID=1828648 RepID=UPI001882A2D0|nr:S8 family serine peptidase [Oculatella sp. LEGE 06141]MBE9179306.1 S8 family serine peptidase [Oculatella sp. LEGE 06141]
MVVPSSNFESYGNYMWRNGQKINLEKSLDRFTVMPSNSEQLDKIKSAPGIKGISPITNQVYKVETSMTERDSAMSALRSEAFRAVAHHAYLLEGAEGTVFYLTNKIIVRFEAGAELAVINSLFNKYSLKLVREYENNAYLVQVTTNSGENPIKIANRLMEEEEVISAEPNIVNRFQTMFIPPDPLFRQQWHLDAHSGPQLISEASVMAPTAWDITRGERSVIVAVLDDGFDLGHPDFKGENKIVFPKDYIDGDASPFPDSQLGNYHGTPCAGVAIAESNGRGVVGIAHGCAFMPVRCPLQLDDNLLIEIFEEVGKQANVISCSWGPPPAFAPLSKAVSDKLAYLANSGGPHGKGCVICVAAGNFNAPINDPLNSGGFIWLNPGLGIQQTTTGPILNGFAAHPDVITVAASTSLNKHAAYSNWGPEVNICAPSDNSHPLDPQKFVPGRTIWTTDNERFGIGFAPNSRYTGYFGGTSSATPLVAGVAALVLSVNPELTAVEVKEILQLTADKIVDSDPDIIFNTNRGQYDSAERCDWFGFGKVNAARAVAEAQKRRSSP